MHVEPNLTADPCLARILLFCVDVWLFCVDVWQLAIAMLSRGCQAADCCCLGRVAMVRHLVSTVTGAADTEVFPREPGTALPQLTASAAGEEVAIPKVSPGKSSGLPNFREIRTAADSHRPSRLALIENARR